MSVRLSKSSGEALVRLQRVLRISERPPLLRLALAIAIRECQGKFPDVSYDSKGPEIPLRVITGGQELLMDALVVEVLGHAFESESDRRRVYKHLVDYGLAKMLADFEQLETRSDYLLHLARHYL